MLYHSFPLGRNVFKPSGAETAALLRSLTEYRQALRLLAFCDKEHGR